MPPAFHPTQQPAHPSSGTPAPDVSGGTGLDVPDPEGSGGTGSRLLFFSGGTALKDTSRLLADHTPDCVHLVTPFDSGGSSAALRRAFAMPAVGDARSRIMALADVQRQGHPEVYTLFAYRLPKDEPPERLKAEMTELVKGEHPLIRQIPAPLGSIIREHLTWFTLHMPPDFPLAGASLGNLALAAGYLRHNCRLEPAISLFSGLLHARGLVRPIVEDSAHLAVRLESGAVIIGQHRFTGKAVAPVGSPIRDIWLTASLDDAAPVSIAVSRSTASLISSADCICYPMGSFYSSLIANLLPTGIGRAVADNPGRKVFVPNLGSDPELLGHTLALQIKRLLRPLRADAPDAEPAALLNLVLVDTDHSRYPGGVPVRLFERLGIRLISLPLAARNKTLADPRLLAEALLRVAAGDV